MSLQIDLMLGDLVIKDDGKLGFTIYNQYKKKDLCWFNKDSEDRLIKWLEAKNADKETLQSNSGNT